MKKKFLAVLAILLISCSVRVCAAAPLINADAETVINALVQVCGQFNVSVWGKEYYTYEGLLRCELHWGNSKSNLIRFRLDNNNNVQRALVSFPIDNDYDSLQTSVTSGFVYIGILAMAGLTKEEIDPLGRKVFQDAMENPYAAYFHKTYSIWSAQTRRNIIFDVELKNNRMDYYMYAD